MKNSIYYMGYLMRIFLCKFQQNVFYLWKISTKLDNPQINCILRDTDGNIINTEDLGKFYEYIANVSFDTNKLDVIYNLKIGEKYNYRVLTFTQEAIGGYVQLLINVDSEITLIDNYRKIITNAVVIGIILSSIASLVLSKNTLKPIEKVLRKQTEFVENVSHELRTPLTIIQAKQELLLQEPNEKIIDKSEEIMLTLSETKRLSKMIKDLTVILKGTNLKVNDLQKQDIKIDELIQNITIPYKEIALAQEKVFKLNLNFNKDIGVDINKIHQLLVILLDNSIKYTETGDTIQINTFFKDNKCNIEVVDTGIGISDEGLKHVFDRFYREDKARNRETGGSGLGLSIATTIVKSHNGTIKASHNKPKGTIFTIKLPR